jgi:hypothetical protein
MQERPELDIGQIVLGLGVRPYTLHFAFPALKIHLGSRVTIYSEIAFPAACSQGFVRSGIPHKGQGLLIVGI